jgi:RecB family exonuclease
MPFAMYRYRRIGALESALRKLPCFSGRVFLVADSGDRNLLSRILCSGDPLPGCGSPDFKIRRWDEIYRYFADELNVKHPRVQIDPPDHWLLLKGILSRSAAGGLDLPPSAGRHGFLTLLGSQVRELIREEVPPDSIEGLYSENDRMGRSLVQLYRAYLSALDERGLSDSAGVTTEARKLIESSSVQAVKAACAKLDVALVGFSSLTHSQLHLIRTMVANGAMVRCYSPEGAMGSRFGTQEQFGEDGTELTGNAAPFQVKLLEGGDPRQELETAARTLALWEQNQGPLAGTAFPGWENIAFSVPSGRLSEAREVFGRYGLPVFWNFRLKVTETPLWGLASMCLDAASGGWQTEPVIRLLSLPWLCGLQLDAEKLRASHPRGYQKWLSVLSELHDGGEALQCLKNCANFASAVQSGGEAVELLEALRDFAAGRQRKAAARTLESPAADYGTAQYSAALQELERKILFVREVVRDLGDYGRQKLSGADAAAYLTAWADGTTVSQGEGNANCMNVFADTPPTLFHAQYFFLIGTQSSAWPGGLKESPLISEALKQKLHDAAALGLDRDHLPLLGEKRRQREFLFRRLTACGDTMTFLCCSLQDEAGHPQEITSFFRDAEKDGWSAEVTPRITRTLESILPQRFEAKLTPVETWQPDPGSDRTLPASRVKPGQLCVSADTVSFSSVDDYAACPYFFALKYLLKYEEPLPAGEYDVLRGGTALHDLWLHVWQRYSAPGDVVKNISALAAELFDEVVRADYPALFQPPLSRVLRRLRFETERCAHLQDVCEAALHPLRLRTECEYSLPVLEVDGVKFTGRCDRLDILQNGEFVLWDYKSGRSGKYKNSLQLACYALALKGRETDCITPAGWAYLCMRDGAAAGTWMPKYSMLTLPETDKTQRRSKKTASDDVEARMEDALALLKSIAASLAHGYFPPNYESDKCRFCSFRTLCRRGEFRGKALYGDDESDESGESEE